VLIVEKDGGVYSCDHFVDSSHRIGSIFTDELGALACSPVQLRFGEAKRNSLPAGCLACRWLALCSGGCPKDRYASGSEAGKNHLCEGLRQFFSYTEPAFNLIRHFAGKGMNPGEIGTQFLLMMQSKWNGVTRNDPCPCGSGRKAKNCCWSKKP